jgi:hypothetical protein
MADQYKGEFKFSSLFFYKHKTKNSSTSPFYKLQKLSYLPLCFDTTSPHSSLTLSVSSRFLLKRKIKGPSLSLCLSARRIVFKALGLLKYLNRTLRYFG